MAVIHAPCRDCGDHRPGCHNPEVCRRWAAYAARKAERDALIRRERVCRQMMDEYDKERSRKAKKRKEHGGHAE